MIDQYRLTTVVNRIRERFHEAVDGCSIGFSSDRAKYKILLEQAITEALVAEIEWLDQQVRP
jgi:hypothetical protein